jgi:hypothetical protein
VFEAKRSDRVKLVWWDGTGLCLMAKKLESGGFKWPGIQDGVMRLTAAQLGALLEGLDWRRVHADVARLSRKSPVDGAFSGLFTQLMLMDLPDDIEALRAFALEQSRRLADVILAKGEANADI